MPDRTGSRGWNAIAAVVAATLLGCETPPLTECAAVDGLTPICEFQNPEDLVDLKDGSWLLVSQGIRDEEAGSLLAFRPADGAKQLRWPGGEHKRGAGHEACPGPPDATHFSPHGIDLSGDGRTLYVVNHGGREAVEIFGIAPARDGAPSLTWRGCVVAPDAVMMNDVAALPGCGFVATKMLSPGLAGNLALARGKISGHLLVWEGTGPMQALAGSEASGPNGVETTEDGGTLYVAEWAAQRLTRMARDGSGRRSVDVGFRPDNFTWTPDGELLVAGQVADFLDMPSCLSVTEGSCGLASMVARVDPETLETEILVDQRPATVAGGASVALEHDGKLWIGTFGGNRLVWTEARPRR